MGDGVIRGRSGARATFQLPRLKLKVVALARKNALPLRCDAMRCDAMRCVTHGYKRIARTVANALRSRRSSSLHGYLQKSGVLMTCNVGGRERRGRVKCERATGNGSSGKGLSGNGHSVGESRSHDKIRQGQIGCDRSSS